MMNEQNEIEMIFLIFFYLAADFYSKFYYNQERIKKKYHAAFGKRKRGESTELSLQEISIRI